MSLSEGDREWIQRQIDRVHDRINVFLESDAERDQKLIDAHEEKHHNPVKTWAIIGGVVGLFSTLWELIKLWVHLGKK